MLRSHGSVGAGVKQVHIVAFEKMRLHCLPLIQPCATCAVLCRAVCHMQRSSPAA